MNFKGKANRKETLQLLEDLISIKSVNPMGRDLTDDGYAEKAMGKYVRKYLEKSGIKVRLQKVLKGRENVIGFLPGKNPGRSLLLEAHMDTVPADGAATDPFSPIVKNGRVYGRGACDDKGPLAAMLIALKLVVKSKIRQNADIYLVAAVDEEFLGLGANRLVESGFKASAGVVGEPTNLKIIAAHKGKLWLKIHTFGKSTHSSGPDKGNNAIYMMNEVISVLRNKIQPYLSAKKHKLLNSPTISIGKIYGGSAPNMIPNKCTIEVDCRLTPNEKHDDIIRKISAEIKKIEERMPYFKAEIEKPVIISTFPLNLDLNEHIVKAMVKSSEAILGKSRICRTNYYTDAGTLTDGGIPSVVFGPGDIIQAHSENEFVDIKQVVRAAEVYAQIIMDF